MAFHSKGDTSHGKEGKIVIKLLGLTDLLFLQNGMKHSRLSNKLQFEKPYQIRSHDCWNVGNGEGTTHISNLKIYGCKEEGFIENVKELWGKYNVVGTPDYMLQQKLKILKSDITRWNKEVFGKLEIKKKPILEELAKIENDSDLRELTQEEKRLKRGWGVGMNLQLNKFARDKEISYNKSPGVNS